MVSKKKRSPNLHIFDTDPSLLSPKFLGLILGPIRVRNVGSYLQVADGFQCRMLT